MEKIGLINHLNEFMKKKFIKPKVEFNGDSNLIDFICKKLNIQLDEKKLFFGTRYAKPAIEEFFYKTNQSKIDLIIETWNAGYSCAKYDRSYHCSYCD